MTIDFGRVLRAMTVLALAGSSAACATITRGTSEAFVVQSEPGGAAVRTCNGFACDATPCTFKMARKSDFSVTFTKPGYKTLETRVTNHVSGAGGAGMAGNVLVGGVIGVGVDAFSGAMLNLVPNPLAVKLEPEPVRTAGGPAKDANR